jgi:hypothetical protein
MKIVQTEIYVLRDFASYYILEPNASVTRFVRLRFCIFPYTRFSVLQTSLYRRRMLECTQLFQYRTYYYRSFLWKEAKAVESQEGSWALYISKVTSNDQKSQAYFLGSELCHLQILPVLHPGLAVCLITVVATPG